MLPRRTRPFGGAGAGRDTAGAIAQLAAMFSDRRLKDNITKLVDGAVNIYAWTWKHISEIPENMRGVPAVGVIAQEVEVVLPEAVSEDNDGIKNVAYGNMVGLLIEAIKELKDEVNELKRQIKEK